jgi:hypothetical protein
VVPALVKLLRVASIVLCLIVIVSTLLFAVNRTSTASGHQREELGETTVVTQTASKSHENAFHKGVDEVAEEVTAPVSGLVSSSSEWANHGIRLVFALLVYGFGLGYLARAVRVRT